ncbi:MAG: preprotein translocase subunit SecE [Candidatus Microsaccharimonas sp.]
MADKTKVTRITATDTKAKKPVASKPVKAEKIVREKKTGKRNIFVRIGGYFKGAWFELRQVRWPNRKATWSLTLAVILFSIFFVILIVLLDTFFKWIFELIIT